MLDPNVFGRIKTIQDFDRERAEFEFRKRQREMQEQLGSLKMQKLQNDLNAPKTPFRGESIEAQKLNVLAQDLRTQNPDLSLLELQKQAIDRQRMSDPKYTQIVDPYDPSKISYVPLPQKPLFNMQPTEAMNMPVQPPQAAIDTGFYNVQQAQTPPVFEQVPQEPVLEQETDFSRLMQGGQIGGISLPSVDPRAVSAPPTQIDAAKGINQANINLQEYAARKNIDLNLLDAEQQKQLDFERRLLNLKNEAALSKEEKQKIPARKQFDEVLGETISILEDLKEGGGVVAGDQSLGQNMLSYLASTEGGEGAFFPRGQDFQRMVGSENQELRDKISGREPRLFNAIKKASGLTGTELNSAFEIENQLKQLGNDLMSYEARIDLLTSLSSQFGTGKYTDYVPRGQRENQQSSRFPTRAEMLIERYTQ